MMRAVGDDEAAGDDALPGVASEFPDRAIAVRDDAGEQIKRMPAKFAA